MEDSKTSDISDDDSSASQTIAHLDLSLVHQKAFPSFLESRKYDTFPCNFFVLGFVSGSTTNLHVQGDGGGGLFDVIPLLRSDQVQYCGFRISRNRRQSLEEGNETEGSKSNANLALKPYFVLLRWIGRHTSALQVQNLEKDLDFLKGVFSQCYPDHYFARIRGRRLGKRLHPKKRYNIEKSIVSCQGLQRNFVRGM